MPNASLRRINKTDMRRINSIVRACNTHNFSQATKTISNMNINSTKKMGNTNARRVISTYKKSRNMK